MASLNLVIIDDHPVIHDGLSRQLGDRFTITGNAFNTADGIDLITRQRPDVAVCDLDIPGGGGIAVVRACAHLAPIIMFTVSVAERDVLDAVAAGAVGYLDKTTSASELADALTKAASGDPVLAPQLAVLVLDEFRRLTGVTAATHPLSPREREVLGLIARAYTNRAIARELYISDKTVETHIRNVMGKLHLQHRAELIRFAVDHRIT